MFRIGGVYILLDGDTKKYIMVGLGSSMDRTRILA